ncbi:uncharacterized protein LOC141696063 [Apium graveolens]|uniref:uncharacterized protein LOC141696063 n=1 Tax=Apium graveolens TaxID=4045 RepID=UPI003D7923F1
MFTTGSRISTGSDSDEEVGASIAKRLNTSLVTNLNGQIQVQLRKKSKSALHNSHVSPFYTAGSDSATQNHPPGFAHVVRERGTPSNIRTSPLRTIFSESGCSQNGHENPRRAPLSHDRGTAGSCSKSTLNGETRRKPNSESPLGAFSRGSNSKNTKFRKISRTPGVDIPSTRLFDENNGNIDFESTEHSVIPELQAEEGDLFWDDDYINPDIDHAFNHISESEPGSTGYYSLGPPTEFCRKCDAVMWKEERTNKNVKNGTPKFSLCCCQGGKIDYYINCGRAPYVYRLNGQNHHNRIKSIKVDDGDALDVEIIEGLVKMLDETNQLVKKFRMARDRFKENPVRDLKIKLKVCRSESGRENFLGPSDEVSYVIVGDIDTIIGDTDTIVEKKVDVNKRDIVMEKSDKVLERIFSIHPSLMALQYLLLFPLGEDGYHDEIPYIDSENQNKKKRKRITMKEYYAYRFQVRRNEGLHVPLGGRLYQQYVVDAFSCVEQSRLWWLHSHQKTLRCDLYNSLAKKALNGQTDSSNVGKGFILPANFLGSKRYMQQNFQDALAVCRVVGHTDIFSTMMCNPLWDEIQQMMEVIPGCNPRDSPDIIARVFHLKLEQLLEDIKKKNCFGTYLRVMYVVEFQKRGLPHVHMLIWLDSESKRKLTRDVDNFVSVEILDPITDPLVYEAVKSLMIHGPCGLQNTKSPCMNNGVCAKHFLKKYCRETYFDQSGFPIYKRRNTGVTGHDRATIEILTQTNQNKSKVDAHVHEINAYFDGRYICASEAAYRIFSFSIHFRSISVLRLSFYLPGERSCTFNENEDLDRVVRREQHKLIWNEIDRVWSKRKKGQQIGRLLYTHHNAGELWYLRLLLSNVRGSTSFESLKTVHGIHYRTFQNACKALGLLDDDNEWHSVISEGSVGGFLEQIRHLFVHIIVNCQVSDLRNLWDSH